MDGEGGDRVLSEGRGSKKRHWRRSETKEMHGAMGEREKRQYSL